MGDPANKQTVIELKAQNTKKGKKNLHQLARLGDHIKIKAHLDDIGSEFGQEDISKGFFRDFIWIESMKIKYLF